MNTTKDLSNNKNRLAIVAGGMGYVGSAMVRRLAKSGMKVAVLYHIATPKEVSGLLSELSGHGSAYSCDLKDAALVERTMEKIVKEQGMPYVCIDAAGSMPQQKQLNLSTVGEVRAELEGSVIRDFIFLKSCAFQLKKNREGIIIGITTAGVVTPVNTKARGAYSMQKFALQGMLVALKEELAPYGINVYSIAPGVLPGGLNRDTPKAFLDIVRAKSASGKIAEASDIADIVASLCTGSDRSEVPFTILIAPESENPKSDVL